MKYLIIGGGGREHALAWRLASSENTDKVFVAPGNPGIDLESKVDTVDIRVDDHQALIQFAKEHKIDLSFVGPEAPLAAGIVDDFEAAGVPILGPTKKAAQLESSKSFAKRIMAAADVPTARYESFKDYEQAKAFIESWPYGEGLVIKASELASGKGVIVCDDKELALDSLRKIMKTHDCGIMSEEVVIEEKLRGKEVSVFALCDGEDFRILGMACDYKALKDGGRGPNTGGMGCYAPAFWVEKDSQERIHSWVIERTLKTMFKKKNPFKGILFVGLMMTASGPKVLEYNTRFGDPETQVLMPLINEDLGKWLLAAAQGHLSDLPQEIELKQDTYCVHVVSAAQGYPGTDGCPIRSGDLISVNLPERDDLKLFYAGVGMNQAGKMVTKGGRVLGLTALGANLTQARKLAYEFCPGIHFEGLQRRGDIGD